MRVSAVLRALLAAVLLLPAPGSAAAEADPWAGAARTPGKVGAIAAKMMEEAWLVPGGPGPDGKPALLKARVFRPAGAGPFKVAIINHGSPASADKRPTMAVPAYRAASEWFVGRGYMVVVPQRRGYGDDSRWAETYGACGNPDYVGAGRASADDIEAVTGYLRGLPMVRKDRVLLVGQSAGGFGVIATAQRNPDGVFAVLNFAGGRGGHQGPKADQVCSPDRLVAAARGFGAGAKPPSLWLYAKNDTYFEPALSQRMAEAYRAAGGKAEYLLLPAFKSDGHEIFGSADGRALWTGPVGEFLKRLE